MSIEAYAPGKSKAPPGVTVHKLSSNETPLGPSAEGARGGGGRDGQACALSRWRRQTPCADAIAHKFGLDGAPPASFAATARTNCWPWSPTPTLNPGDEGIYCTHGFLVYRIAILAAGGVPVIAPEQDFTADVDAILAAVTPRTKIVYLANPNNPTGTYLPFDEIKRLHAGLPPHVLLVLDAAYAEYVRRNDYAAGLELVIDQRERGDDAHLLEDPRGSPPCGSAGWWRRSMSSISSNRIRPPFNVNAAALAAGAAAIADDGACGAGRVA